MEKHIAQRTMKRIALVVVTLSLVALPRAGNATTKTVTIIYSFGGTSSDGADPVAGLVLGSDGNFYGTTRNGGSSTFCPLGCGTVFRVSPSGTYTSLYSFGSYAGDGGFPYAGLVQGNDSNFYGTTEKGGAYNWGTVFRISPSGTYTTLYNSAGYLNESGHNPVAGLVQGSDGNFYGTATTDGRYLHGSVFRISPSGTYTTLYAFVGSPNDGADPVAGLVLGSDSNFYGTTEFGGASTNCGNGCGTIFRISPDGSYTNLYSFNYSDGGYPQAGLVQGIDGNFYGTTFEGGTDGGGTVFQISPSGSVTTLYSFATYADGSQPIAGLVQGSNSNFYGTTEFGGKACMVAGSCGTIFRITPGGDYTNLHSFVGHPGDGASPEAGLVQGSDGNLYGTTAIGGKYGPGSVFKVSVGCTYTLSATNFTLAARGGVKRVRVKVSGTDCSWTAESNDPFITIISGSNGMSNGSVTYAVPGNTNTTALSGTMTIAGQTFTVNQIAGGCTYSLSPTIGKIQTAGGLATVKVKPNFNDCAWSAVSNDSFITITDGASGIGKGTVTYVVAPNPNTNRLTGSITIAGKTFTVIQQGEK